MITNRRNKDCITFHKKHENETELSKYISTLQDSKNPFQIK